MYSLSNKRSRRKARKVVDIHQNKFNKAYVSTIDDSRRPLDSLSDMTNMEIVQDYVPRPRPPLVAYGTQPANTVIGRGSFSQDGNRYILWAQNVASVGKLYKQMDGGSFTLLGGTYDNSAWLSCVQNLGKLYIYNGVDNLSYVDLSDDSINTYTSLSTPSAPTVTMTGATSSGFTYYYRISANNEVGESIASVAGSDDTNKPRDNWIENTDYMTITWASVTNATSYTVYIGNDATNCKELYTTTGTTFIDYGTLAPNPYKLAPEGNSTEGAIFTYMYVDSKNSQILGITADNKLYYSAPGSTSSTADFSPYNGGGFVPIDPDGSTTLNYVTGFRNGKGDPVVTVSARGAAGKGKLFHVTFEQLIVGDETFIYPDVYEANGQAGTYAPRATIKARDAIYYPTGQDFKSTGTSQNIVNILTTNTISQGIEPDVNKLTLSALNNAVGLEYQDRLYYGLPVGSSTNNEIWYLDLARKNLWVLRWPIDVTDMWLYEDNSGSAHFCVLSNNAVLEFTRAGARTHQDNNVAWRSRLAFNSMVWDEDGITLGKIRRQYFKLLQPRGNITVNATGLTKNGTTTAAGSDNYTTTTTSTGIGQWLYGGAFLAKNAAWKYGDDPGTVDTYGKSVAVLQVKPKGLLAELGWEIVADTAGTDYTLSSVRTKGQSLDDLVLKG